MDDLKIFWGDTHDNVGMRQSRAVSFADNVGFGREHLDFHAPTYYVSQHDFHPARDGAEGRIGLERWKSESTLKREWAALEAATGEQNEDGHYVTFPGYEWQGDGRFGDHNVIHRREGYPIFVVDTLPELFERLRGVEAIAVPHHTAYPVGARGKDWSCHDERLTPFAEIHNVHGCSETDEEWIGLRVNVKMGPGVGGGTYQDALNAGLRVGAIGSTDGMGFFPGHYGWGLMACLAPELTREALWDAFACRRVYAVTGDRIELDFRVDGAPMGDAIEATGPRRVEVVVRGWDEIDRVEVLRGDRVIHTYCHQGAWTPPRPGKKARYRIRVEVGMGGLLPNEARVPPREWNGRLVLSDGVFTDWAPAWVSGPQVRPSLGMEKVQFELTTPQIAPSELAVEKYRDANSFEFLTDPGNELLVESRSQFVIQSVSEFADRSHLLVYEEETRRLLAERFGVDPDESGRPTAWMHFSPKVKIHRAMPEAAYTASFSIEDDAPLTGETHYRIRVEQRNGQRAWSSPIWVGPPVI